jgi:hypothetical protein
MHDTLMAAIYFLIATLVSAIGAISGIGGGMILKPVMDSLGTMSVPVISFLTGCAVLSMSSVSLLRSVGKRTMIRLKTSLFLAIGASVGGIAGKGIFQYALKLLARDRYIGIIQATLLLLLNIAVLLYMVYKGRIRTFKVLNPMASTVIGLFLGILASFLGIGGGPINIAVLYCLYSMRPKETVLNSLFIIFCSQIASLATSIAARTVPSFPVERLVLMCSGAIGGSYLGGRISHRTSERGVEHFFLIVLILLVGINIYNITRFSLM